MPASDMQHTFGLLGVIGIAAVAVALGFLAIQIRRNIRAIQHNANVTLRGQFVQIQMAIAGDETLAEIYERGLSGLKSLSGSELVRFFMIASSVFTYWQEAFFEAQRGLLPAESWQGVQQIMGDVLQYPGAQEYWALRRHWYADDMQKLVDRMIAEASKAKTMYPQQHG